MTIAPRSCGSCTACCRLLPVPEIWKPALKKCDHQSFKGCRIYETRPNACRTWSCLWLLDASAPLRRPDRCGFVIDPVPDVVTLGEDAANGHRLSALQVWLDPARPLAHRDLEFRKWFEDRAFGTEACIIARTGQIDGIVLIPPWLSEAGEWREIESRPMPPYAIQKVRGEMFEQMLAKAFPKPKEEKNG